MLIPTHDTERIVAIQPPSVVGDSWTTEVLSRLPADLAEQARALKAFQRGRGLATPHNRLRGLLAYVLRPLSTRRLGAWAVLLGLAALSEAAWRQRLRRSNAWLLWLGSERMAPHTHQAKQTIGKHLWHDVVVTGNIISTQGASPWPPPYHRLPVPCARF
jgi:hypothetical protein